MIMLRFTKSNMRKRIQDRNNTWSIDTDGGNKFGIIVDDKIRKLSPLEIERLMGFPDNWTEGLNDRDRYKMLGNSVVVPVVEYLSKFL